MSSGPLVSVICLCHNQAPFVEEAVRSVVDQDYPNVEPILVDDGSTDGSKEILRRLSTEYGLKFIDIPDALGNCRAFNKGLAEVSGTYVIDLAADDVLLPHRISRGIELLEGTEFGIQYGDCLLMDSFGQPIGKHSDRFNFSSFPSGDLYIALVGSYFISPPSMMIRKVVFNQLGGYDESLTYEDFDFWVRSARDFTYVYSDDALVKKRILKRSLSSSQNRFRNRHQKSTLKVCRKIYKLNRNGGEHRALRKRCWIEIKQCIKHLNLEYIPAFIYLSLKTYSRG